MKTAAIYARVSGDQQPRDNTIASQTEALVAIARERGYSVSADRIFEDCGFTGAFLERPGLERVRDLAAEGWIEAVVVCEPGRLSRNYAYEVLLTEEWARNGAETVFVKAPTSAAPEDRLAVQVQSMLAEYERAQMLERSRRGKRHRAQRGEVSILGGAPYGYRYWKKTADRDAWYEVVEPQASVVREVFDYYTVDHLSIGAIAQGLNERCVRTASGRGRWERSTVWGMLRNPAFHPYPGGATSVACEIFRSRRRSRRRQRLHLVYEESRQPSSRITRSAQDQPRNGAPARFDRGSRIEKYRLHSAPVAR